MGSEARRKAKDFMAKNMAYVTTQTLVPTGGHNNRKSKLWLEDRKLIVCGVLAGA
jgi:hypothetical protein